MAIPTYNDGIVNGWSYNYYTQRVTKSCSNSVNHNYHNWDKTTSQKPIRQYSSEELARKAMITEKIINLRMELKELEKTLKKL